MKKAAIFLLFWAPGFVILGAFNPRDDSDSPSARSGFSISTDALTGCQYLNLPFRAATPRIAADGKSHQGCRGSK